VITRNNLHNECLILLIEGLKRQKENEYQGEGGSKWQTD